MNSKWLNFVWKLTSTFCCQRLNYETNLAVQLVYLVGSIAEKIGSKSDQMESCGILDCHLSSSRWKLRILSDLDQICKRSGELLTKNSTNFGSSFCQIAFSSTFMPFQLYLRLPQERYLQLEFLWKLLLAVSHRTKLNDLMYRNQKHQFWMP